MPPKTITMLSGLTTAELTLTNRGANNKRFAMTKGSILMDPDVLAALISTPAEGEAEFIATLKSAGQTDQERIDAAVVQYRMQKGMKDLVDDKTMAAVAKSAGYKGTSKAVTPDEGKDDKKPDVTAGKVDPKAKKKDPLGKSAAPVDLSGVDDATKTMIAAIFKSNTDMLKKSADMEAVIKSMQDEKLEREFVAKAAKDFGHLPLGDLQLGLMLKSAHDVSPDFAKGFEGLLGRMDEMVSKSDAFSTVGAIRKANEGGGWDKIQALANGMVQKSVAAGKEFSNAQAINAVLKSAEGAALYREYLGDNPKQRAEFF